MFNLDDVDSVERQLIAEGFKGCAAQLRVLAHEQVFHWHRIKELANSLAAYEQLKEKG